MNKYTLDETSVAYALLSMESCEHLGKTWHETNHMNILLRTRTGSDILSFM